MLRLMESDPGRSLANVRAAGANLPEDATEADAMRRMRAMKAEAALLIALADIGGVWDVTQVTAASADPTGVATWQGASLPTADTSDPNQVTVVQNQPRALLSWTTFNVGQNTTLTFQQQQNGVAGRVGRSESLRAYSLFAVEQRPR